MIYSLEGLWKAKLEDGSVYDMHLPGTLDENKIGYKDRGNNQWHPDATIGNNEELSGKDEKIATRFTRKYTYEGKVELKRRIHYLPQEGKRLFLEAERARCLKLYIDGKEVSDFTDPSISTPHVFEITGLLHGDNEIVIISDNSYPGLPRQDIVSSSAATDETQTNWNGILGYFRLREEECVFFREVRVLTGEKTKKVDNHQRYEEKNETEKLQTEKNEIEKHETEKQELQNLLNIHLVLSAHHPFKGMLMISSKALKQPVKKEISIPVGDTELCIEDLEINENICCWDEYEGNVYEMTLSLSGMGERRVHFGIRSFGSDVDGRLTLNGRRIFLRSEANCAEFPEEGHPPMTVEAWKNVLNKYKSYGVNCMRFHSNCPPEAAFTAADELGILMQPELSHWNPKDALLSEESYEYYKTELVQIIKHLGNHPSFVMLTLGNELWTDEIGKERMNTLVRIAKEVDHTRLYAIGSNAFYGTIGCDTESDFYTSVSYFEEELRGTSAGDVNSGGKLKGYINNTYPNAKTNFNKAMEHLRESYKKPVFSFEVGQYEILPDFDELKDFKGISEPENLRLIKKRADALGLSEQWKTYVEATGELSLIGYREEIEAVLRTQEMSGISLLGLQDFPGQGTALVGMMNSHLNPKPYPFAMPERFRKFFRDQLPLVYLNKYTYQNDEILTADINVANYGKEDLCGEVRYLLKGDQVIAAGSLEYVRCEKGKITAAGTLKLSLNEIKQPSRLNLTVSIDTAENTYPIWVYPPVKTECPCNVYVAEKFDENVRKILAKGGTVYLSPASTKEALPSSIQTQFTTDFWSVGTFPAQEGSMGQLIDVSHPILKDFPTEFHTNWQWWPMASTRAVIIPIPITAIITEIDSYAYMRSMAQLFECRCGGGKLLFSSMGLQNLQQFPEARALQASIYRYLASEEFLPTQELSVELITGLTSTQ